MNTELTLFNLSPASDLIPTKEEEISSAKEATDILGYIYRWKFESWIEAMDGWDLGGGAGRDGLSKIRSEFQSRSI